MKIKKSVFTSMTAMALLAPAIPAFTQAVTPAVTAHAETNSIVGTFSYTFDTANKLTETGKKDLINQVKKLLTGSSYFESSLTQSVEEALNGNFDNLIGDTKYMTDIDSIKKAKPVMELLNNKGVISFSKGIAQARPVLDDGNDHDYSNPNDKPKFGDPVTESTPNDSNVPKEDNNNPGNTSDGNVAKPDTKPGENSSSESSKDDKTPSKPSTDNNDATSKDENSSSDSKTDSTKPNDDKSTNDSKGDNTNKNDSKVTPKDTETTSNGQFKEEGSLVTSNSGVKDKKIPQTNTEEVSLFDKIINAIVGLFK